MPPMATSSSKRDWSEAFQNEDVYDRQSIMDMCNSKLRYVIPANPPRRRTEAPLLRNVLIVNTMKVLSADMGYDVPIENSPDDLMMDPSTFDGLPPLSELLTDIMLDPPPCENLPISQNDVPFSWSSPDSPSFTSLTPLEPSLPSYMDTDHSLDTSENKTVHNLMPCTSVVGMDPNQQSVWEEAQSMTSSLGSYLPSDHLPLSYGVLDSLNSPSSDSTFQASCGPLPSFTSVFDNSNLSFSEPVPAPSYTDLVPSSCTSLAYTYTSSNISEPTSVSSLTEDLGTASLTDDDLQYLAMAISSKMPHMSFEELVQSSLNTQQSNQYVPSSLQGCNSVSNNGTGVDSISPTNSSCASFYSKDQSSQNVDENMVRVLVNL